MRIYWLRVDPPLSPTSSPLRAQANAAAEALLARLSPAARARSEELLLSDTPDQQLEAAVVQLTVLGACAGGRGRTAGAGGSAAQ